VRLVEYLYFTLKFQFDMSAVITFGSIGDIIAVSQITVSLVKALSDTRGSTSQYQALIKELKHFDQALR
jgi:hypothetical protein